MVSHWLIQKVRASLHMKPFLFGPCLSFSDSFSSLKLLKSQVTVHLDLLVPPTWDVLKLFAFAHVALFYLLCPLIPFLSFHLTKSSFLRPGSFPSYKCLCISPILLLKNATWTQKWGPVFLCTLCVQRCAWHIAHARKVNWMNGWRDEQICEYYGCYCLAPFGFLLLSKSDGAHFWEAHSWWWQNLSLCI